MTGRDYIILGTVVVVAILIICSIALYAGRNRDGFGVAAPATPLINQAVTDLYNAVDAAVGLGSQFEAAAKKIDAVPGRLPPAAAAARRAVAPFAERLREIRARLKSTPPVYANYLVFYRGIAGGDDLILRTADAYRAAGHAIHQAIALDPPGAPNADIAEAGALLIQMSKAIATIPRRIHQLGSALDAE